jgi:hypothetical protein
VPDREVSASYLRKSFQELRGDFSKCYSRWSRSGQNDPEIFPDFASCGEDGYLNSVGERCCILAAALTIGTLDECKELSNFTVRLCDSGVESDLDGNGRIKYSDMAFGSSSQGRKRKLSYFKYGAKGVVKRLMRTCRSRSVLIGGLMLEIFVCLGHFFPLGFSLSPTDTVSHRLENLLSHSVVDIFDLVIS